MSTGLNVGLWIDRKHAIVVFLDEDEPTCQDVPSDLERRVKAPGGSRSAAAYTPQGVVAEDRLDRKFRLHLQRYYERVAHAIEGAASLFIMGPGEAKHEFHKYLQKSHALASRPTVLETVDKMTQPQIVARVRAHFED